MVYDGIKGHGYARGPYGLLHFQDSGGLIQSRPGELPLVLLHQSPASTRQFERAFKPLVARGIRFIAIDTPGFGFPDPSPAIPKLEDWAPSFVAVLEHLGLECDGNHVQFPELHGLTLRKSGNESGCAIPGEHYLHSHDSCRPPAWPREDPADSNLVAVTGRLH